MTIICPRCAARFSVAQTTGITCPACGAKLALRDDPSRRSSTPSTSQRRPAAPVPIIDLPVPKRAISVSLDPQGSSSRGNPASLQSGRSANARPKERWRLRPEQLAELPAPVAAQPRTGRRSGVPALSTSSKAAPATGTAPSKAAPPALVSQVAPTAVVPPAAAAAAPAPTIPTATAIPAPAAAVVKPVAQVPAPPSPAAAPVAPVGPIERAMPRIPVTRPEIPAGAPPRVIPDEVSGRQGDAAVANPAAAKTRQELEPVASPPKASPDPARAGSPAVAAAPSPSPTTGAVAAAAPEAAPASARPASEPARALDAPAPSAGPASSGAARPIAAAPAEAERPTTPAAPPKAAAPGPVTTPASEPAASPEPPPAESETSAEATPAGTGSGETAPAATSAETHVLEEGSPPPAVQLGWVIAILLGLAVLLVTWLVYRGSVGH